MFASLLSLLTVAVIALAAYGVGRPVWQALRLDEDDPLEATVWSLALGLLACGLTLTVLGLCGILHERVIGLLTLVATLRGLGELLTWWKHDPSKPDVSGVVDILDTSSAMQSGPTRSLPRAVWLLVGLVACGSLVAALAPPTAGDAMCYHLELPKRFLLEHKIVFLPDSDNSTFPLLVEVWYLWALALDGGVGAQLVHWGLGVLLALATVVLARPIVGRPGAWMAGAVVLLVPGINDQMAAPLNDVGLALMTTLALAAWWRATVSDRGPRWFVLTGLMLGGALGTKYIALVFVLAMIVGWLWVAWRQPQRRGVLLRGAMVTGLLATATCGIWYARAAYHRGNPVYPFLHEYVADADRETLPAKKAPLGRSLTALAEAPWQVTMHPERFGGRGHQLGPLFPMLLPALLVCRRLRGLGVLMLMAAIYALAWFLLRQNVRFLFPLVPLLTVPLAWIWCEWYGWPHAPRLVAGGFVAVLLASSALLPWSRCRDSWQVAVGLESREAYLHRREPTFDAAALTLQVPGDGLHILSEDPRAFYFPCRVTRENLYRRRTQYDQQLESPHELSRELREAGFTHLLLAATTGGPPQDDTLSRLAEPELADELGSSLVCLTDYTFTDTDGAIHRYRLVMLR